MLLRKLDAYGFKSFADKTEVEFGPGVTAVVGPNGSGKSNIADAIRWVLGEQSVRSLRGAKSEDLIFAGSSSRRPLGVAEVSLTFDNSDGAIPLDYGEVVISRRIFRSGESEYYINKNTCRLKDIAELLADTGLGREAMNVIGQNNVDDLLNSKPEERRLLFEDAAGISKFKQRKRDALRKLEDTEKNLTRVSDIIAEIEAQIGPLQESAAKTEKYNHLRQELTSCQVTMILQKLDKADQMNQSAALEQAALTDREIALNTSLSTAEAEQERLLQQVAGIDAKRSEVEERLRATHTELERNEGKAAVLAERIVQSGQTADRAALEKNRLVEKQAALEQSFQEKDALRQAKAREATVLKNNLLQQSAEWERLSAELEITEKQIAASTEQTFDQLQELVSERNRRLNLERDGKNAGARRSALLREQESYQLQLEQAQAAQKCRQEEQNNLSAQLASLHNRQNYLQEQKKALDLRLSSLLVKEKQISASYSDVSSRYRILSAMQEEYEGFGRGIKGILKSQAPWRPNVCGAVAELIDVPGEYVLAVETALGGALQNIVTENENVAKACIEYLKQHRLGRATFLPLNRLRPSEPRSEERKAASSPEAIGFAADLVHGEPRFQPLISYLLGRTIVAKDINAAIALARQYHFSLKIVTLEGELFSPGGAMAGGSSNRREASFLSRHAELSALASQKEGLSDQLTQVQKDAETIRRKSQQASQEMAAAGDQLRREEVRQAELSAQGKALQEAVSRAMLGCTTIEQELAGLDQDEQRIQDELVAVQAVIQQFEDREKQQKQQIGTWQEQRKVLQEQQSVFAEKVTESKVSQAAVEQELIALSDTCRLLAADLEGLERQRRQVEEEQQQAAAAILAAQSELATVEQRRGQLNEQKGALEREQNGVLAQKMEKLALTQRVEREIKEMSRKLQDVQRRLHDAELMVAKYGYEVEHCTRQLTEQFSLNRESAEAMKRDGSLDELAKIIHRLEEQIFTLGPVNPGAIEEFQRVQERYGFLQKQSGDLREAKEYLRSVLQEIDGTMSRQFKKAFDQINEYFGDIFVQLFGGGKAHLELIDPANILETGIEIQVQPPGKKQQNLALLSGGERALTVIAILFSVLTFRPAPFCVVDEIDAALDEANVQRFCKFLRDYSQKTQFVVITHRKGTMEAADVLHGVTIEESGVSRLVSVKLMEKAV